MSTSAVSEETLLGKQRSITLVRVAGYHCSVVCRHMYANSLQQLQALPVSADCQTVTIETSLVNSSAQPLVKAGRGDRPLCETGAESVTLAVF